MKLYSLKNGVNPRRVRIFLAEKRVAIPIEEFDMESAQHKSPEFLAKNPFGTLPVLELDDGTLITESIAICRYFEESVPEPPLFGRSILERAQVEMWNRRMELELFRHIGGYFQHTSEIFKNRIRQLPEAAAASKEAALARMRLIDGLIAGRRFIAGERYTIADITGLCAIDLGAFAGLTIPAELANLTRWHAEVSSRPSARA